jgi:predicted secreted protein
MSGVNRQDRPRSTAASSRRRWTLLRLILLTIAAIAGAIVMGLYAFLTAWYTLAGSG